MKHIFVYGILQKHLSAKNFGLEEEYYLGRARLDGYERESLTHIIKSNNGNSVEGDIFLIPDYLEQSLYDFEKQFGYSRGITKPVRIDDDKEFECISYLLEA